MLEVDRVISGVHTPVKGGTRLEAVIRIVVLVHLGYLSSGEAARMVGGVEKGGVRAAQESTRSKVAIILRLC